MVWVTIGDETYAMRLTDGYVRRPVLAKWRESAPWCDRPFEQGMAEHVYRLGKSSTSGEVLQPHRPDPLHVWIIGQPKWLQRAPQLIREISEGESSSAYRIVIIGQGMKSASRPYLHGWPSHVYAAGMTKTKKHLAQSTWRSASEALMELVQEYYIEHGGPGTPVLEAFGLPVQFRGDYRKSDEIDGERIQQ